MQLIQNSLTGMFYQGGTMRSIFILAIFGTLLLTGVSSAETNAECKTRCSAEKASNDENCSHAEETFETTRARCLQDNQETHSLGRLLT